MRRKKIIKKTFRTILFYFIHNKKTLLFLHYILRLFTKIHIKKRQKYYTKMLLLKKNIPGSGFLSAR